MQHKILTVLAVSLVLAGVGRAADLVAVLNTGRGAAAVDTIIFIPGDDTIDTPGFGGVAEVMDTFNFGERTLPDGAWISYLLNGSRQPTFEVRGIFPDTWITFPDQRTWMKFAWLDGIEENPGRSFPVKLSVSPNPFTSRTSIRCELNSPSRATMRVYDESGREVRTMASTTVAGLHAFAWDGRDQSGARLSPGVYIARLDAGPDRSLVKLVLTD